MTGNAWQQRFSGFLKGQILSVELYSDVDELLVLLARFDAQKSDFCAECVKECGDEAVTKRRILELLDSLLLRDERDILRMFGRRAFADTSKNSLKRRYQRLRRVFHPDHRLSDEKWLTQKMSVVNRAYELAQENFEDPYSVEKSGVSAFNIYSETHQSGAKRSTENPGRRRYYRQHEPSSSSKNDRGSIKEADWLTQGFIGFKWVVLRKLYRLDAKLDRYQVLKKLKIAGFILVVIWGGSSLFQLFLYATNSTTGGGLNDPVQSNGGGSGSDLEGPIAPVGRQPSDDDIETMLDRLLKENSTINAKRTKADGVASSGGQRASSLSSTELEFKWTKTKNLLPDRVRPDTEHSVTKVDAPESGHTFKLKPKAVNKALMPNKRLGTLSTPVKSFIKSVEQAYAIRAGAEFAAYFIPNGRYFRDIGRDAIAQSRDGLAAEFISPVIKVYVQNQQVVEPWVYIRGALKLSFINGKNMKGVNRCIPVTVIIVTAAERIRISSIQVRPLPQAENSLCGDV